MQKQISISDIQFCFIFQFNPNALPKIVDILPA